MCSAFYEIAAVSVTLKLVVNTTTSIGGITGGGPPANGCYGCNYNYTPPTTPITYVPTWFMIQNTTANSSVIYPHALFSLYNCGDIICTGEGINILFSDVTYLFYVPFIAIVYSLVLAGVVIAVGGYEW